MNDTEFDRHLGQWFRAGPSSASPRVLRAVVDHVHAHRPDGGLRARWHGALDAVALRWPAQVALRPIVLLALLALSFALGAAAYASWQQVRVIAPLPSPTPSVAPVSPSPAPVGFTCPPGTDPDRPGPIDQERPPDTTEIASFDQDSGRVVVVGANPSEMVSPALIWTFDVCTNSWENRGAGPGGVHALAYDPSAGLTLMLGSNGVATYDVETDTLRTISTSPPSTYWLTAYDPGAGRLVLRDMWTYSPAGLWTYDLATDKWTELAQRGDVPSGQGYAGQLLALDFSVGRLVLLSPSTSAADPFAAATYEFDLGTSTWTLPGAASPELNFFWKENARNNVAYDESAARTLAFDGGRVQAYDATAHQWRLASSGPGYVNSFAVVYDPINERTLLLSGYEVRAFDMHDLTWKVLLAGR